MRPRNKREIEVTKLSEMLHKGLASAESREYAIDQCFDKDGVICKGETTCLCCGATFKSNGEEMQTCPHCGREIKTKKSRIQHYETRAYFCEMYAFGGYEVVKTFMVVKLWYKGKETRYDFHEVMQDWYDENAKRTTIALPRCGLNWYCDVWRYNEEMSIKRDTECYAYNICPMATYTDSITQTLRRNGFAGDTHNISPRKIIAGLLGNSRFETLWKAGQYSIAGSDMCYLEYYWAQIKIAMRHNYTIEDYKYWCDYLDMARNIGRDIHNPQVVCPVDIKQAHDIVLKINKKREEKKRMEEARQRLIREAQEAKRDAENFIKNKGMYLGITFGNKDIVVTVLDSIDAYIEEGAKMHHCVFQCKYYNKNNSLILSAKDINGNRLATIELSLIDWNILQCRGVGNSRPSQYDEIVSLVNNNIGQFQQAKLKLAS